MYPHAYGLRLLDVNARLGRIRVPGNPCIFLTTSAACSGCLAATPGLDAVVDIDPNDVVAILSVPGELHRIQISLAKHKLPEEVHQRMRDELATRGIERKQITANLLMIQDSSAKLADIGQIVKPLLGSDYENALENGWCWQNPSSSLAEQNLEWLLVVRP